LSKEDGFTLLELMVVVALIAITAAFTMPKLSPLAFSGTPLQQTARKLSQFIKQSSRFALRSSQSYQLIYNHGENKVALVTSELSQENLEEELPSKTLPDSVVIKNFKSYYRGTLPQESMRLLVSSQGYIEPSYIYLQDDSGNEMTLKLSPFLGDIEISAGHDVLDADVRL